MQLIASSWKARVEWGLGGKNETDSRHEVGQWKGRCISQLGSNQPNDPFKMAVLKFKNTTL